MVLIKHDLVIRISILDHVDSYFNDSVNASCLSTPFLNNKDFEKKFQQDVHLLVIQNNIHKHTSTCYKYCKNIEKQVCRMRMPRKIQSSSMIDADLGLIIMSEILFISIDICNRKSSILQERLHPTINNYNEFIMACCRCNMDIKFIWTGSDTKALVYYVCRKRSILQ